MHSGERCGGHILHPSSSVNVGEQNRLGSSAENGAKSSFLSTGEIPETQIREKSSLRVTKPVLAGSCGLETEEEAQREEHITPVLLRRFSSWKGVSSERSRALEKHLLSTCYHGSSGDGDAAAPGSAVRSGESAGGKAGGAGW